MSQKYSEIANAKKSLNFTFDNPAAFSYCIKIRNDSLSQKKGEPHDKKH